MKLKSGKQLMKAIDMLNKLQKAYNQKNTFSTEDLDGIKKILKGMSGENCEKIMKKYEQRNNSLLTQYEDFHLTGLMDQSYEELRNLVFNRKINVHGDAMDYSKQFPIYGTIHSHDFGANIIPCDDVPLIVFNEGLLHFTNRILSILNFENLYHHKLTPTEKSNLTKEFIDIMIWFHFDGDPYYAQHSGLDSPIEDMKLAEDLREIKADVHQDIMWLITTGVYFFFVAHEYAHTLLVPLCETKFLNATINDTNVEILAKNWEEEIKADKIAFILSKETTNIEYGISSLFATIIMYLSHIHELEGANSHPPFEMRIDNIVKLCKHYRYKINYNKINTIINPKIDAYIKFLIYIKNRGLHINSINSICKIQKILYEEYTILDS